MLSHLLRLFCLLAIAFPVAAHAEDDDDLELDSELSSPPRPVERPKLKSIIVGHNVTPTTETIKQGVFTVGNYAVAVGLTDSIFIASSPWIWVSYNTANAHIKWSHEIDGRSKVALFGSYFQSYNSTPLLSEIGGSKIDQRPVTQPIPGSGRNGRRFSVDPLATTAPTTSIVFAGTNRYQWQSASLHALYSNELSSSVTLYLNAHYGYFWNDDFPYSIRMDPGSDAIRGQLDLTSLTDFRLGESGFHFLFEFGALGVNYLYPYMQLGGSIAYTSSNWLVQLGASATMQFNEVGEASGWMPGRYDGRIHYSESEGVQYYYRYLQTAVHPEIQLQWFY